MTADENLKTDKSDEAESEKHSGSQKCQDLVVSWVFVTGLSFRMPIT